MGLPKDPRQKMINMMYLVLIAMLALNVSAEILNAFKTIKYSLEQSILLIDKKNQEILQLLVKKTEDPTSEEKAKYWLPIAEKSQVITQEIFNELEKYKLELKKESGLKLNKQGVEEYKLDDLDATSRVFIDKKINDISVGLSIRNNLKSYIDKIINLDPKIKKKFEGNLILDVSDPISSNVEGEKLEWDYAYFHMTPTIAALALLTKFQFDVKLVEEKIISYCLEQVGQVEIIYDEFNAFTSISSEYILPGENVVISAGVGAFNKDAQPTIYVDGNLIPVNAQGVAIYNFTAHGDGPQSKKVKIFFIKPDGTKAEIDKVVNYTIGQPSSIAVSTDKTRVFYKGLENPLSIKGSSGDENIHVNIEGNKSATITKVGKGQYIVRCNTLGNLTIHVDDGKESSDVQIPIKRVPDPIATCNGSSGGSISANIFRLQKGIIVDLKDFVFEGVDFKVQKFIVIFQGKGFEELIIEENTGPAFNQRIQSLLKRCEAGTTVTIAEIFVSDPGGGNRRLQQNMTFILE